MGIPFVSEVWNGIRWIIDFFVNKTPRPIQFIIFLLLILLFGNLFSIVLHLIGVHCRSDGEVIKTRTLDVTTNSKILWLKLRGEGFTEPNVTVSEVHPWGGLISQSGDAIDQCVLQMKYNPSKDRYEFCDDNETNCINYYDRAECFNCTELDVGWVYGKDALFKWFNKGKVCDGDAYPRYDLNWFQRNYLCNPLCAIPEHYKFSRDELLFQCVDLDYCGVNATKQPNSKLDEELLLADGDLIYTDDDNKKIERFVGITCSDDYDPRIALFGKIDIFDYRYWLLIIVVYVMIMFLTKIRRQ